VFYRSFHRISTLGIRGRGTTWTDTSHSAGVDAACDRHPDDLPGAGRVLDSERGSNAGGGRRHVFDLLHELVDVPLGLVEVVELLTDLADRERTP